MSKYKLIGVTEYAERPPPLAGNVLQLNADFVLYKICDLGAVSRVCRAFEGSQF